MSLNTPRCFDPIPNGWRFLNSDDSIQMNDVVLNEITMTPEFCIGSNHTEIGQKYDVDCVLMARKIF